MKIATRISIYALLVTLCLLSTSALKAQELQAKGIDGMVDKYGRSPQMGVRVTSKDGGETVTILADGEQTHDDYSQYPLRFDFYVNRQLVASQFRSDKLPGAVGIDVGPHIAEPPFNYAVVVSTISPNGRSFSSVITGAVYSSNLFADLICRITFETDDSEETYVDSTVSTNQSQNGRFSLSFSGQNSDNQTATAQGVVNVSADNSASANLAVSRNSNSQAINVSGSVSFTDDGILERVFLESEDDMLELLCTD